MAAGTSSEDTGRRPRTIRSRRSGRRVRAYVGLGANLGQADTTLRDGIRALARLPGVRVRAVSRLYATRPVGVLDQPEFRNAVVALDVAAGHEPAADALRLLVELKRIERVFGRGAGPRWGPRVLDLDLLVFGRARFVVERPPAGMSIDPVRAASADGRLLEIPHRSAHERLFVLAPLSTWLPGWFPLAGARRSRRPADAGSQPRARMRSGRSPAGRSTTAHRRERSRVPGDRSEPRGDRQTARELRGARPAGDPGRTCGRCR